MPPPPVRVLPGQATRARPEPRPRSSGAVGGGGAVAVRRHGEPCVALGHRGRHAAADAHALGGVGAVERVAGDVVQLGEPAALGERQQQVDRAQRFAERALDALAEDVEPLAGERGDEHTVRVAVAQLLAALIVDAVGLVEHEQPRPVARADLVEHALDRAQHLDHLVLGDRRVDDVDDEVGEARLLERRAARVDELVGQLADEADGVGDEVRPPVEAHRARVRVERVEEAVADAHLGAGERVEQRRLAGVRVAGERDLRQLAALALGAHRRPRGLDLAQLAAQRGDPVAGETAVGLELGLAGAAGADAALAAAGAEALEVRPQAAHAGEVVLELGELDLELALRALRVPGEDVEDDRGAVDDRHPELLLEVAPLARRELVVDRDEVRVGAPGLVLDLRELARAEVRVRVRRVAVLDRLADRRDPRGAQQLPKLGEVVALLQRADRERALLGAAAGAAVLCARLRLSSVPSALHGLLLSLEAPARYGGRGGWRPVRARAMRVTLATAASKEGEAGGGRVLATARRTFATAEVANVASSNKWRILVRHADPILLSPARPAPVHVHAALDAAFHT